MPAVNKTRTTLVDHLASQAPKMPVNDVLSLSKYYRSADLLISQAHLYRSSHNEEQLYVMLMRFASLLIETIPRHKDYSPTAPPYVKFKQLLLEKYLPELEKVKLSLNTRDLSNLTLHTTKRPAEATPFSNSNLAAMNWSQASQPAPPPLASSSSSNGSAAWDFLPPGTQPAGTTSQYNSTASLPAAPVSTSTSLTTARPDTMARHALIFSRSSSSRALPSQTLASPAPSYPKYPAFDSTPAQPIDLISFGEGSPIVTQQQQAYSSNVTLLDAAPAQMPHMDIMDMPAPRPQAGLALGPQQMEVHMVDPSTAMAGDTCTNSLSPRPGSPITAMVPSSSGSNGGAREYQKRLELRDVHVSVALMEEFLQYAQANTRRSIESCGILAGVLTPDDSILTINTLIVPQQKGTSDTVEMLAEEEIYEVMSSRGLLPLGWIHTHPSQTCFLSSIDIHTHCGFQTQLDEAVAIVMAPTDRTRKCGIFRLTTPGGLSLIQKCSQRGFHPHPPTHTGQEIYEDSPHLFLNPRAKHTVIDLRN